MGECRVKAQRIKKSINLLLVRVRLFCMSRNLQLVWVNVLEIASATFDFLLIVYPSGLSTPVSMYGHAGIAWFPDPSVIFVNYYIACMRCSAES